MGCVSSREARLDRLRSSPSYGRSVSMPVVHGSNRKGDSLHVVSLTSSTIGFLKLSRSQESSDEEMMKVNSEDRGQKTPETIGGGAGAGVNKPTLPESETINAWELMEDLEEEETALPRHPTCPSNLERSFSFDHRRGSPEPHPAKFKSSQTSSAGSPKPYWLHSVAGDYFQLDPDVISNFRKAMTELSPQHPTLLHRSPVTYRPDEIPRFPGIVKARVLAFEEKIDARRGSFKPAPSLKVSSLEKSPPGGKGKVVLYSTSLRGVRMTYENCCNARVILRIYGVRIDERDVSMHRGYKDELNEILGYGYGGTTLPRVFVNGRHLGGAEEVARLHEDGELVEVLKGCEMAATAVKGGGGVSCQGCGDYRFLPCVMCSGSCKVFVEEEEDEIGGFRRCPSCNENGLVRCHLCC
ncbi:hypothetical protein KSP39_PZI003014 [Platanthera zijinensis]|uniref:Glutaredoxin domain-containing protein n=1 Tax=Platanthera zijinensis TaxID=2320716 RepID=A0AAP0GC67_9ASPA